MLCEWDVSEMTRIEDKEEEKKTVEKLILHANSKHAIISNYLFVRSGACTEIWIYSLIMSEA